MVALTRRVRPGLYETVDGQFRVQRVAPEAWAVGYADGWHLLQATPSDPANDWVWCNTFVTKADALDAAAEIRTWIAGGA